MSDQEGQTPRRALAPRDDESDSSLDGEATPAPRRGRWSATGPSADAPSRAGTPIPPPAVLPESDVAPASAGRRFSAVDLPVDGERPLPRRSALSPAATRARSPRTPDPTSPPEPGARIPHRRLAIGSIAAVVVGAIVIGVFLLFNSLGTGGLGGPATSGAERVETHLVQTDDLNTLRPDTTWTSPTTVTAADASTPLPACLAPVLEQSPPPAATLVRLFSPETGAAAGLLHQVETYNTPEEAAIAYATQATQLAGCERNTAWIQSGLEITGLADEATGAVVVLQGEQSEFHTIILSRTGSHVNIMDAAQAEQALDAAALVPALAATYERQCADGGTCPTSPTVAPSVPPATEPRGFLTGVDLPRITPGAGAWRGTPVSAAVSTLGSRCEAVDLTLAPAGSVSQQQRTLVLQEDAAAPPAFGIDEVLYTFNTPEEANGFVGVLAGNIDGCADRTGTAEVARSGDLAGPGTGPAWVITRKLDQGEATARFRVAVLATDNHAVYVMVNPSTTFDFSDEAWHQVALRAAERLAQLP